MVSIQTYYNKVKVSINQNHSLGTKIQTLLDEVIQRLPDDIQFQMKGQINFYTRQQAIEYWDNVNLQMGTDTDFRTYNKDGNCTYIFAENVNDSIFVITIIIDNLGIKSDDYIKGLIAHEISEMSYSWIELQCHKQELLKLKPKARQVRINQITNQNAIIGTREHQKHEDNVDNEAIRLGFSKEIFALNER